MIHPTLLILIRWAEHLDGESRDRPHPRVVLNVGGTLVSGQIISEATFLRMALGGLFAEKGLKPRSIDATVSDEADEEVPEFIFLAAVEFIGLDHSHIVAPVWCGRIAAVDGFCIGELSPPSSSEV